MSKARKLNMAETSDKTCNEDYFFGFAKFFDFEMGRSRSLGFQDMPTTNTGEENFAYLCPKRLDFVKDMPELCVIWSTLFELGRNGKVKVCGWGEGRIISPKENIILPLDEKIVTLRGSWNRLLMISEKGRCHVMRNVYRDWTVSSGTSGTAANEEGAKETTWFTHGDVGDTHCIVVDEEGRPYQIDQSEFKTTNPFKYLSLPMPFQVQVDQVSCGEEHVLLLSKKSGTVYSFGLGSRGQLGHGDINSEKTPKRLEALSGIQIKHISAGGWHSLALSEFGDVYSWGWNECGQLGITCVPPEVPLTVYVLPYIVQFPDECDVVCIACGARHSVAVTSEPEINVWTWGWGAYGQLGHGDTEDRKTPTLVEHFQNTDSQVESIACGRWQTIVRTRKKN